MRKGLLILITLLIVTGLCAFEKGTLNPGGTVSYTSYKFDADADAESIISFAPQVGYFFIDNLAGDLMINFENWTQGDDSANDIGVGIGARYFYNNFYGGLGFMYHSCTDIAEFNETSMFINVKAGYMVPIVENVCIDLGLKYKMGLGEYGGDASGDNNESTLGFMAGLQIFFPFMQ